MNTAHSRQEKSKYKFKSLSQKYIHFLTDISWHKSCKKSQLHSCVDENVYQHIVAHFRFASTSTQMWTINYNIGPGKIDDLAY
jgi:hypothetical protein